MCLSRQNTSFAVTKICLPRQIFVVTNMCLWQQIFCHDKCKIFCNKTFHKQTFAATKDGFCWHKTFVATKMILVAAPTIDKSVQLGEEKETTTTKQTQKRGVTWRGCVCEERIYNSCLNVRQPHRVTSGQSNSGHKQIHISKLFSHIYQPSVKSIHKTNHFADIKHAYTKHHTKKTGGGVGRDRTEGNWFLKCPVSWQCKGRE